MSLVNTVETDNSNNFYWNNKSALNKANGQCVKRGEGRLRALQSINRSHLAEPTGCVQRLAEFSTIKVAIWGVLERKFPLCVGDSTRSFSKKRRPGNACRFIDR